MTKRKCGRPRKIVQASQASTVIIPAYHAEAWIGETLDSITRQTEIPEEILIGVDADPDTMAMVVHLRDTMPLNIRAFYFPRQSWPYRIRNTLALHATRPILHFFDADDIMYPQHCEHMGGAYLTEGRFMSVLAEMQEGDAKPIPWERAAGVVSIRRSEFIRLGGFEPWKCAADTEAHTRWRNAGLLKCRPKAATMLVRKHPDSLTRSEVSGYGSPLRDGYKREIARRLAEPVQLSSVAMAECREMTGPDLTYEAACCEMPCVEYPDADEAYNELTVNVAANELGGAYWLVNRLVAKAASGGYTRDGRELLRVARQWLKANGGWGMA